MSLSIVLNGQPREFAQLDSGTSLNEIVGTLELKGDRIAVEHNGTIAQRALWDQARVNTGDRLEIVHFVGGGL
jgi:sulfur carrier protein